MSRGSRYCFLLFNLGLKFNDSGSNNFLLLLDLFQAILFILLSLQLHQKEVIILGHLFFALLYCLVGYVESGNSLK